IPWQPRYWVLKDRRAVLLYRHQVLQGVDTCLETGGDQACEQTGDVGTVLRGIKQTVVALTNRQLQGALDRIVVEWRPLNLQKARQRQPMPQEIGHRFPQT